MNAFVVYILLCLCRLLDRHTPNERFWLDFGQHSPAGLQVRAYWNFTVIALGTSGGGGGEEKDVRVSIRHCLNSVHHLP